MRKSASDIWRPGYFLQGRLTFNRRRRAAVIGGRGGDLIRLIEGLAALVAENRRLAAPASVDSVPTSGMQEDHVSMGWGAALKLRTVLDNLAHILAVELVSAARAQDLRRPLRPSPATMAVRDVLRTHVPGVGADRFLAPELAAAEELIRSGAVLGAAESVTGPLQ